MENVYNRVIETKCVGTDRPLVHNNQLPLRNGKARLIIYFFSNTIEHRIFCAMLAHSRG